MGLGRGVWGVCYVGDGEISRVRGPVCGLKGLVQGEEGYMARGVRSYC